MSGERKNTDELREEWNRRADHYASNFGVLATKFYTAMLPFLQLTEVQTVVEAACGPGNGVELLRQHIPPTARVLANDISARFVEIVREKGYPNVEVVEAVNEALPYPDACADRYVANMSLHLVEFPDRMLAEAFRILKSGGIAAFSIVGDFSILDVTTRFRAKYNASTRPDHAHFTELQFKRIIQSSGFSRVVTFEEMAYKPVLDVAILKDSFMKNPLIGELYMRLDDEKKAGFEGDLEGYLRELVQEKPLGVHARIALAFKP